MKKSNNGTYYGLDVESEGWGKLIPLMFILAIVPLIVYLKVIPLKGIAFEYWNGAKENADFFSYYKMLWFIISSALAFLIFSANAIGDKRIINKTNIYIPAVLYLLCIIVSSFLAEHKSIALYGFPDRYEGMYVLCGYIIIMILTINVVQTEKHMKLLVAALLSSAAIISIIGIFQYLGHDLFTTNIGKSLILPGKYESLKSSMKFLFDKYTLYGTLYHSNYVGSYAAILIPLSFTLFLLTPSIRNKLVFGILTTMTFIIGFGSNSRAGMVGSVVGIVLLFFMLRKFIIRYWKYFSVGFILLIIVVFTLNSISSGKLLKQVSSLVNNAAQIFSKSDVKVDEVNNLPLKDVKVSDQNITIVTATEILNIYLNNGQLTFKDRENKEIAGKAESGTIYLVDERYKPYELKLGKYNDLTVLQCKKDNFILNFAIVDDKFKMLDGKGNPFDVKPVERIGFEGKESLGSARGYIWSRTFPLILKKPILGYGPDTFPIYFPQNEFMAKYRNYDGRMWELVDKPHNLYIQIAVSTGIPSLIAFLTLILMYIVSSVRVFFSNKYKDTTSIIGVGIFAAIMGYLGAGFFNDSVISVAPVFWVLLGLGIKINLKLKSRKVSRKNEKNLSGKMNLVNSDK